MKGISIDIIFIDVVSLENAESATKHPLIDSTEQLNGYFKIPHLAITQSDVFLFVFNFFFVASSLYAGPFSSYDNL